MSYNLDSTICACATGNNGAISVIRVSGPQAVEIADKIFKTTAVDSILNAKGYSLFYGSIYNGEQLLDEVLLSVFRAPASYTGEDVVEISCHGSQYIVTEIINLLIANGAVAATAGEFTKRAFLNGKMDLTQAEAVASLIQSETKASHDLSIQQMKGGISQELAKMREELLKIVSLMELELDFSEEDVEFANRKDLKKLLENSSEHIATLISSFKLGNAIKNGVPVAIVGNTNTGKSTLLNVLLGEERAIVSSIPGTTRDSIEDVINIDGILFRFIDTAGIRNTIETIEKIGIERTYYKIKQASVVLLMLDYGQPQDYKEVVTSLVKRLNQEEQSVIVLVNKCDIPSTLPNSMTSEASDEQFEKNSLQDDIIEAVDKVCEEAKLKPLAILPISAKQKIGLNALYSTLSKSQSDLTQSNSQGVMISNIRHYNALKDTYEALLRASVSFDENVSSELIAQDIREALYNIGTIVGTVSTDEILGNIFKNFCIGK